MTKKLNVILCASGHLPSGTGEVEFEALYQAEIKPLIMVLNKFPQIDVVFYYSGVILYWMEQRHPESFMLLEDLLSRRQAEFLGGGFYAPVLPLLPVADKIGQIEMLTTYLRKRFGKRPQGCWLPAMAWEQNLVGPLNSCGMNYTFLEDLQFRGAGAKPRGAGIYSPCITEDQGKLITVFPVAGELTRVFRNGNRRNISEELSEYLENEDFPLVVFPVSGNAVRDPQPNYEKLLTSLSADSLVEFISAAKAYKSLKGLKKVYFPGVWTAGNGAGNEMHPKQFLANYPEAGGIYSKMIHVHTLINNQLRGDKTRKLTAREELWKAQDSGIFRLGSANSPGLLHSNVRKAAYRSLLEAEKITREKRKFTPSLSVFDFDLDGEGEYIFQDEKLNCAVQPRGAGVFELDYLPCAWNYLDTLAPEAGKSEHHEQRYAFVDWLAPAKTLPENAGYEGISGGRFCGQEEYDISEMDRVKRRLEFRLPPKPDLPWGEIEIEKSIQIKKNALVVEYVLKNTEAISQRFVFCPAIELSFPGEGENYLSVFIHTENGKEPVPFSGPLTVQGTRTLEFQDIKNETVVTLETNRKCDVRLFNVYAGFSGLAEYQSTCVMPLFPVSLEKNKTWKTVFSLRIGQ